MLRHTLYALFALGGVSALIYEVLWMRAFRLVFGSSTRSAGAVLAAFFLGMALGNLIGSRLARRADVVRLYGWTEIVVALAALLVGPWLSAFAAWYPQIYSWTGGHVGWLTAARLTLAFVALGPPTVAMGITLPLVTRAVVTHSDHIARQTGWLYALNILGAFVGAFLAGFVLPPQIGVAGSMYVAVGINLVVGVIALGMGRRLLAPATPELAGGQDGQVDPPGGRPAMSLFLAAAISGFGTLALEVVYMRILSQHTDASVYSFAMMLMTFLLFLALGSAWVARRLDRTDPWRFLAATQSAAVLMILASPLLFQLVEIVTRLIPGTGMEAQMFKLMLATGVLLGPTILLVGVVLPTTWKIATREASKIGRHVGILTAVNTAAAVVGSLLAGFLLLPWLGVVGSVLAIAPLYAVVAAIGSLHGYQGKSRWIGCAVPVIVWTAWLVWVPWRTNFQPLSPGETLISYRDGETASVAVVERPNRQRKIFMNHRYLLGASTGANRELRQGRLPLALHPKPRRVAFIGVATGITVSAVLEPPVEQVVAIEIVPGVADAVGHFEAWNRRVFDDPRVQMVVADGRNHLLGTPDRFDVIVSDLFVPWHAGTGDLYTVDHFRICRDRLATGGLFAQALPLYQLSVEEFRSITASFLEAFPAATLWRNDFDVKQPVVCLVGYRSPQEAVFDAAKVRENCRRMADSAAKPTFLADPEGLGLLYLCDDAALRRWADGAPLNTDDRPFIEFSTPRSHYIHKQSDLDPMWDVLAGFQPRVWPYAEPLSPDHSFDEITRAADLWHEAVVAGSHNLFGKELRLWKELIEIAGYMPAVSAHTISVARRYRRRQMNERANELLQAVIEKAQDPLPPILALAKAKIIDGDDEEAIQLLQRAAELDPDRKEFRRPLVELLTAKHRFEEAEPLLSLLVEAAPDDPDLRLDLARSLHSQDKTEEAAEQIEAFRKLDLGDRRDQLWTRLRTFGLGIYVDRPTTTIAPER